MNNPWQKSCQISPSLIYFDMCKLGEQISLLEQSGIELLHIDIIDGHFSPSMPLGMETVRQLRKRSKLHFDVHLMATENDYFVDELLDIGIEQLVFHVETVPHIDRLLRRISDKGVRAGVALKPATPLSVLNCILENCDTVLLMLTNPGFSLTKSEKQVSYADRKIHELREMIDKRGLQTSIEIDGRVTPQNIETYGRSIVDIFVAGSACFSRDSIVESFAKLNDLRNRLSPCEGGQA